MNLKKDNLLTQISEQARQIRYREFSVTNANVVPTLDSPVLTFGTTGKSFYGTVLYIDIRHSTDLLNNHRYTTVAKMLIAYYNAIVRVAKETRGEIRSFNGDSLLVFYKGDIISSANQAVRAAFLMTTAIVQYVNPAMGGLTDLDFGIGIDYGKVLVTKVGMGGANQNKDLIWIGKAVNRSTKISDKCKNPFYIGISDKIYENLEQNIKYQSTVFHRLANIWSDCSLYVGDAEEKMYRTRRISIK